MQCYLINEDHKDAEGLMKKLSGAHREGAIIPLTKGEMTLYRSENFQTIGSQFREGDIEVHKLEPDQHYMFVCKDKRTNFEDLITTAKRIGFTYGIVRVK